MITSADEKRVLDLVPTGLYINGVWRDASDGKTLDVFDPATGKLERLVEAPRGTPEPIVARMRQVTTGDTAGGRWVILAGVSDGERVIVDGLAKVRPDSPVQVEEAKAATPASPAQE